MRSVARGLRSHTPGSCRLFRERRPREGHTTRRDDASFRRFLLLINDKPGAIEFPLDLPALVADAKRRFMGDD